MYVFITFSRRVVPLYFSRRHSLIYRATDAIPTQSHCVQHADILLKVNPPAVRDGSNELSLVPEGSVFVSFVGHLDRFETEAAPKTEALKDLLLARDRKVTLLGK